MDLVEKIFGKRMPVIYPRCPNCKGEDKMRRAASIDIMGDCQTHEIFQCNKCKNIYYYHFYPYKGGYTLDDSCEIGK